MKVTIRRHAHLKNATIGTLTVEDIETGNIHDPIYTLENPKRKTKVDDRIPAGEYLCVPYSSKKYPNVYEVTGVEGRTKILLHHGHVETDTLGCILLGGRIGELRGLPAVLESKKCFDRFRKIIGANSFTLEILD